MRLLGFISLGLLACVGSSCADSSCGPTSDWPRCNHDDGEPTNGGKGPPAAGEGPQNPSTGGGPRDEGEKPPSSGTGGSTPVHAVDGGSKAPADPDYAGDAGAPGEPASDAGADASIVDGSVDGGAPMQCTIDSDARDAGSCYGIYCAHTPARLPRSVAVQGACLTSGDLALVCDGELTRVVSTCAQDDVLMLGLGNTVSTCARNTPSLAMASSGCIDCYVGDTLCALQQCLAPCLAGLSEACTSCRSERCGATFQACSGLPKPQ